MTTKGRKSELAYRKHRKQNKENGCPFCNIGTDHKDFIDQGKYFKVVRIKFPYSFWDEQDVDEQAMLVPIKHVESIRKLPLAAATEYLDYVGKYEEQGFNVYARSPGSKTKSVAHQHTHLIKTKGKRKKIIVYSRKPFLLFMK